MARPRNPLPETGDDPDHDLRLAIARRLKGAMDHAGLDPVALAEKSGVSRQTAYNALNGTTAALTALPAFARVLDIPLVSLISDVSPSRLREATKIPVKGGASRAVWRSVAMQDEPRGAAADVVPQDERYRSFPRFGVPIEDDSLIGLDPPVPYGSVAIYAESRDAMPVESGRIYFLRFIRDGVVRTAFCRVSVHRDRYEVTLLAPAKEKAETAVYSRDDFERGTEVAVNGILVAVHIESVTAAGLPVTTTVRYL